MRRRWLERAVIYAETDPKTKVAKRVGQDITMVYDVNYGPPLG